MCRKAQNRKWYVLTELIHIHTHIYTYSFSQQGAYLRLAFFLYRKSRNHTDTCTEIYIPICIYICVYYIWLLKTKKKKKKWGAKMPILNTEIESDVARLRCVCGEWQNAGWCWWLCCRLRILGFKIQNNCHKSLEYFSLCFVVVVACFVCCLLGSAFTSTPKNGHKSVPLEYFA